jgi:hypothetical protein
MHNVLNAVSHVLFMPLLHFMQQVRGLALPATADPVENSVELQ